MTTEVDSTGPGAEGRTVVTKALANRTEDGKLKFIKSANYMLRTADYGRLHGQR